MAGFLKFSFPFTLLTLLFCFSVTERLFSPLKCCCRSFYNASLSICDSQVSVFMWDFPAAETNFCFHISIYKAAEGCICCCPGAHSLCLQEWFSECFCYPNVVSVMMSSLPRDGEQTDGSRDSWTGFLLTQLSYKVLRFDI